MTQIRQQIKETPPSNNDDRNAPKKTIGAWCGDNFPLLPLCAQTKKPNPDHAEGGRTRDRLSADDSSERSSSVLRARGGARKSKSDAAWQMLRDCSPKARSIFEQPLSNMMLPASDRPSPACPCVNKGHNCCCAVRVSSPVYQVLTGGGGGFNSHIKH